MAKQTGDDMVRLSDFCTTAQAAEVIGCTTGRVRQLRIEKAFGEVLELGPRYILIPRKAVEKFARKEQKTGRPRKNSA